jgi:hypothetical protein
MTKFLAGVLSVMALGVLLIAYGLLAPRAAAFNSAGPEMSAYGRPVLAGERLMLDDPDAVRYAYANGYRPAASAPSPYATYGAPQTVSYVSPQAVAVPVRTVQTVAESPAPQRVVTRTVERAPRRDWKKTALVIGGSTAAGAGVGGAIGGKKGALIGAAIGGGASTLYESTK